MPFIISKKLYSCLLLILLASPSLCIYFNLESGVEYCLYDEILDEQKVKGNYDATPYGASISFVIRDPNQLLLFSKAAITSNGTFAFHTGKSGLYAFCFTATGGSSSPRVELNHEIILEKFETAAKKESFTAFEAKLFEVEEKVVQLNRDLRYMRRREIEMRDTSESINNRLVMFSIASSIIIALSGIWQIIYLKRYFQKKKLI